MDFEQEMKELMRRHQEEEQRRAEEAKPKPMVQRVTPINQQPAAVYAPIQPQSWDYSKELRNIRNLQYVNIGLGFMMIMVWIILIIAGN